MCATRVVDRGGEMGWCWTVKNGFSKRFRRPVRENVPREL